MAEITTHEDAEVWTIRSGDSSMSFVPAWGGIGSSLVFGGRELLYQQDWFWEASPARTRGGWPFLFPICGRLERDGVADTYLYHGQRYEMPIHGFGPRVPWRAEHGEGDDALTLILEDSEATRAQFPFAFRVELTYRIADQRLSCTQRYANTGELLLPFYAGFHPYFATPDPGAGKEEVTIDHRPHRRLLYNERLNDLVGEGELPDFPMPVTDPRLQELLTMVPPDNTAVLRFPDGYELRMSARGEEIPELFSYAQHYTMEDKGFFCFEPWMSHPNALNTVASCAVLEPGQVLHAETAVWGAPAAG